jgi:serine/threonine protein kinase
MIPISSVLPDFTGRTIDNGQILLLKRIGSGVHGAVYKAARFSPPERINLSLAVKCLLKPSLDSRNARWTDREVGFHSLVSRHPNIVTLHDVFEDERHVYLVLDFSPGGDLFTAMTENHVYFKNNELIKTAFIQLIDAVQHCHVNGVYHRDLKPENILCSKDGSQLQLADFSLATDNPITDQRRIGTSFYMSPG